MKLSDLTEATQPHVEKAVDPALLTFNEYHDLVNPSDKSHPTRAYNWDLAQMNQGYEHQKPERFPTLLNRVELSGQKFEIRLDKLDRWTLQFCRVGPDGWVVRDEHDEPTYYTKEELPAVVKRRWEHSIGIFNDQKQLVASATDEWGTWLTVVATEYRGTGLGPLLGKLARTYEPEKQSGGFTPRGWGNFRKVHRSFVQDYLKTGMYSWLVKSGQLTVQRAKEIIKRIGPTDGELRYKKMIGTNPNHWKSWGDGRPIKPSA